jgi:DUF4097 and DUF4098 domain-containing protein YvlB
MTAISIIISLALFLCASASGPFFRDGAGAVFAGQELAFEKQINVAPGQKLILDLETGGGVTITGWGQNMASVKVQPGGRDWQDCKVDVEPSPDGVKVTSQYIGTRGSHSTSFHFDIQVPQTFNVEIRSAGGALAISNIQGTMSGSTGGGSLNITGAKGEARLSTGGGSITVKNSTLDGHVSTGGGRVLIEDVTGDITGSSGGGNVTLKNVTRRSGQSTGDQVLITNAGGQIEVDSAPSGADVKTGGGRIHVRTARGFVKASTGGGAIDIDSVDGWVKASTGAGRVTVTVAGEGGAHDVSITSGTGDITLTVPPNFSMNLDLKLGYTSEDRKHQIVSDFAMNQQSTDEWSSDEGTPRKYVIGSGSIGGGGNKVRIRTVNGNIYIKRGQ